jgi:hypothetical protein
MSPNRTVKDHYGISANVCICEGLATNTSDNQLQNVPAGLSQILRYAFPPLK